MSVHSEQNIHLQPLESPVRGVESFWTAQQQPLEHRAADVEREATQDTTLSAKSFEEVYIPRPSVFIVHITHTGKIVHRQRYWVTARSLEIYQNLPDIPPNGIRVVILIVGVEDQIGKCLLKNLTKIHPSHSLSGHDSIPYKIPLRELWRMSKESGLSSLESGLPEELANLAEIKKLARLNAHRLQELYQKRAVPPDNVFIAQSNIFESSLPSGPYPDRFYMLHEEGHSCPLQSSAQTWYGGPSGLSLGFWETLSEVSV